MNFGYYLRPAGSYEGMLELARHAEDLGLQGVYLNDHVQGLFGGEMEPFLEGWTALTGIGLNTRRIRIGHIVLFNSIRNPAFLAKSISTLDNMTGGRYDAMIGAGWNPLEYEGYDLMGGGRGMPSARERVDLLKEALQILRGMLENEVFSFEGRYWTLKDAINIPQPIQKPMAITVGATRPRMLRIAVKYADGVNIRGDVEVIRKSIQILSPALERSGKKLDDFHISGFEHTLLLAEDNEEYDAFAKRMAARYSKPLEYVKENFFIGTAEDIIEKLRRAEDLGMEKMVVYIRPASTVQEMKEKLSLFKDAVIDFL